MASLPGFRFDITGASGTQGLLTPKASWRAYILPRGAYASQDSTGTLITFDSAAVASRFAANNWIQAGLLTANIRQVAAVGGNSISISGAALTVTTNDRIFLIGNTQPTVSGGSATYTVPATQVRQRDDSAATLYTNSMITSNADGLIQGFAATNFYDAIIQDSNQANQGSVIDIPVGVVEGVSVSTDALFGASLTVNGALGVTGWATFGSTVTMNAALGVTGHAVFGATVTMHTNLGVTGSVTVAAGVTISGGALNVRPYLIAPRFGEVSGAASGGAIRVVDGSLFQKSAAGIKAAMADLPGTGGVVQLLAGTYPCTQSITIGSSITVRGLGRATILDPQGTAIRVFGVSASNTQQWSLEDFAIIDSGGARTAVGLDLYAADNNSHSLWTMRNIFMRYLEVGIRGASYGTSAGNTFALWGVQIRDCVRGIEMLGQNYGNCDFTGCAITNCTGPGLIYGGRQGGSVFSGCDIENNTTRDIWMDGAASVTFVGLHVENTGTTERIGIHAQRGNSGTECDSINFIGGIIGGNGAAVALVEIGDGVNAGGRAITFFNNKWTGGSTAAVRCRTPRSDPAARIYEPRMETLPFLLDQASGTSSVVGVVKRATGWTVSTGTATRSGFTTSTVTTAVLAEHVKALMDDLILQGVIGQLDNGSGT